MVGYEKSDSVSSALGPVGYRSLRTLCRRKRLGFMDEFERELKPSPLKTTWDIFVLVLGKIVVSNYCSLLFENLSGTSRATTVAEPT